MRLSDEAIEEFRTLYEQEFGEIISKGEAQIRAQEIFALFEKLYERELKRRHEGQQDAEEKHQTSS